MFNSFYIKHKKYIEQIKEDIDDAEKVLSTSGDINLKSFDLHDELNDKVWDKNQNLKPGIREQLLQIARDFYDTLDIAEITEDGDPDAKPDKTFEKYIKDVFFVGSLASFNYSSYADVDIHLLMDEEQLVGGKKNKLALNILKKYFTECKNDWNLKHSDLTVEGYDCELYVQDINEKNAANGVYSLFNDEWVKRPEPMTEKNLDRNWVEKKALDYIEQIDSLEEIIQSKSDMGLVQRAKDELKKIKDKIVQGRRDSLAAGQGEMNSYNILFKILRRSGHIAKINDLTVKAYDMINSFENNFKKESIDMNTNESFMVKESEAEAIALFKRMYGRTNPRDENVPTAEELEDVLKKYLAKRTNKSAEEIMASDSEFEKFSNWAYDKYDIDVYAKFSKHDKGSFKKRTSTLLKDPDTHDRRDDIDDRVYSFGKIGSNYDSATDTWREPKTRDYPRFGESKNVKCDEYIIVEDNEEDEGEDASVNDDTDPENPNVKRKIFLGAQGDTTFVLTSDEPRETAKKLLNKYNTIAKDKYKAEHDGSEEGYKDLEWEKDREYSYWSFTAPEKIDTVKADIEKEFGDFFSVEVQESNVKEDTNQPNQQNQTTDQNANNQNATDQNNNQADASNTQNNNNQQNQNNQQNNQNNQPADQQNNQQNGQQPQQQESESTAKIVGGTWNEFLDNIEAQTNYEVDSAFRRHANQWIELIGKDGQIYDAEVTRYSDGEYELLYTNIHPVPNVESKKPSPLNESNDDEEIEEIKSVLRKYFEVDPETQEENSEYEEDFSAQDAIDEIVEIIY